MLFTFTTFFCQAEDGIRDGHVTGVQTCALPIWSSHNYDLGSLYVEGDRWMIYGPIGMGPQAWGTGGEMEIWESRDEGETWTRRRQVTVNSKRNHKFARRPVNAEDPFFVFWADGNPDEMSKSKLYFGESSGERYWELPYEMEGEFAEPREIRIGSEID